jgi:hypothetical protein
VDKATDANLKDESAFVTVRRERYAALEWLAEAMRTKYTEQVSAYADPQDWAILKALRELEEDER